MGIQGGVHYEYSGRCTLRVFREVYIMSIQGGVHYEYSGRCTLYKGQVFSLFYFTITLISFYSYNYTMSSV